VTREAFNRLVEEALQDIPRRFREEIKNVAIVVEDAPSAELLAEMEMIGDGIQAAGDLFAVAINFNLRGFEERAEPDGVEAHLFRMFDQP